MGRSDTKTPPWKRFLRDFLFDLDPDSATLDRLVLGARLRFFWEFPLAYLPTAFAWITFFERDFHPSGYLAGHTWFVLVAILLIANIVIVAIGDRHSPAIEKLAHALTILSILLELSTAQLIWYVQGTLINHGAIAMVVLVAVYRLILNHRYAIFVCITGISLYSLFAYCEFQGIIPPVPVEPAAAIHPVYTEPMMALGVVQYVFIVVLGGLFFTNYGVNRMHRLRFDLRETQARLIHQGRMAGLGQIVSNMAHEIGNPLNFTTGGLESANDCIEKLQQNLPNNVSAEVEADFRKLVASIKLVDRGNNRLQSALHSLRDFSYNENSQERMSYDLTLGIQACTGLLQETCLARNITLTQELEHSKTVNVSPYELNQLFMNLIQNAVEAVNENGRVTIRSYDEDQGISIIVEDSGGGVDEKIRESIFDPFCTTKQQGEGSGIGLSSAARIAREHEGHLSLVSPACPTQFWLWLPYP